MPPRTVPSGAPSHRAQTPCCVALIRLIIYLVIWFRAPALDSQEIPSVARLADSFVRFLSAHLGCIVSSTVRPFKGKLQRRIPA